ncbi:MAG: hypothetical protein OK456_03715 [Thaumarchaeota archaeon]|nr:hypothetical protein [Nitrososphaerota archaeon]
MPSSIDEEAARSLNNGWMSHPGVPSIPLSRTRKVAVVSVFSALAITTDYAMFPLANIKLMDSIVFVSALAFGLPVGVAVGLITWLVYGTVNPLGPDSGPFLLLLMGSEAVYAAVGYGARRLMGHDGSALPVRSLLWGSLGLIAAFLYDFNTIVTPALFIGEPVGVALASLLPAAPFMVAHELSDFVFFALAAPALYAAIRRVTRFGV